MEAVATSSCWQPPSATARPTSAPPTPMARLRIWGSLVIITKSPFRSVGDEAVGATVVLCRFSPAGHAVDAVDVAKQFGLRVRRRREAVIRPRQVLLRHRAYDIGRHDHDQLGAVVDEVAAAKQRSEDRELHQARQSAARLLGLLLDQAGHRHCATGGYFERGLRAAGLDRRYRQRDPPRG